MWPNGDGRQQLAIASGWISRHSSPFSTGRKTPQQDEEEALSWPNTTAAPWEAISKQGRAGAGAEVAG